MWLGGGGGSYPRLVHPGRVTLDLLIPESYPRHADYETLKVARACERVTLDTAPARRGLQGRLSQSWSHADRLYAV